MHEPRPLHLRLPYLGLALIGGSLGTAAREAISLVVPDQAGIPVAIFGINVLGAFCLGLLLAGLAQLGPDMGLRRKIRILVGTGFMGGFTTYSALATDTARLLGEGRIGAGLAYGLATVVFGGLATWAGIALASSRGSRDASAHPSSSSPSSPSSSSSPEAMPSERSSRENGGAR